jgi:FKBP-type peptidyl-prolyl cis-trans isomerase (trigger factor)
VHSALLLERLASQQRIEVSEAEIDERIGEMLRAASRERERLAGLYRSAEARREVGGRLAQEKALAWVTSRAVVKEAL